jgi:hypothetical protein
MNLIWATRGRDWGFRFLLDGGFADPLPEYDKAFSAIESGPATWRRVNGSVVALRIRDPLGREDAAGRLISHDFVVFGALAAGIESVEDGVREVWPLVAAEYAQVWGLPRPPASTESSRV